MKADTISLLPSDGRVQVPHSASLDTWVGECSLLFLGKDGSSGSPLGIHYYCPGWERQGHLLTVLQVASMQIAQQEAALLPLSSGESLTLPRTSSHTSPGRRRRTVSSLAEGGYSGSPRGLH